MRLETEFAARYAALVDATIAQHKEAQANAVTLRCLVSLRSSLSGDAGPVVRGNVVDLAAYRARRAR
jgi:hypothetical protein